MPFNRSELTTAIGDVHSALQHLQAVSKGYSPTTRALVYKLLGLSSNLLRAIRLSAEPLPPPEVRYSDADVPCEGDDT